MNAQRLCLIEIAENNSKEDLKIYTEKYEKKYNSNTQDQFVINTIKNKYISSFEKIENQINQVYLLDKFKTRTTLTDILESYKGKIVYIDFWASWCAPCRGQFPFSNKLRKEYKDVIFLYISIDKDFEKWMFTSEEENLKPETNYYALNYPNADFYKTLNLSTIPRYLILNKNGRLVHQNAPRPSDVDLKKEFNKYLQKEISK